MAAAFVGAPVRAPYSLVDMAGDAFGLLDHLGIDAAHLCGVSMGGMIVQTMAIEHPERARSLVSIMSTTGSRRVGRQHPSILPMMLTRSSTKEEYVASSVTMAHLIGSPGFPGEDDDTRERAAATWDRGVRGAGVGRQIMAILTQPDRTRALGRLSLPATVVHGLADKMVNVSGGRATSMAIPGAGLLLIEGMGHDLPPALWPTYVRAIRETADRAS
jgi:pimeloyl-ACP methyl ester carboxylesterase